MTDGVHDLPTSESVSGTDSAHDSTTRYDTVQALLGEVGETGMTWKEFDTATGWNHHGRSTAALSGLHKQGRLVRLSLKREKCSVYVLPEHVNGRETIAHGQRASSKASAGDTSALVARNDALFAALDNLAHAVGFRTHKHVWVDEKKDCFLCVARTVVGAERALRNAEKVSPGVVPVTTHGDAALAS